MILFPNAKINLGLSVLHKRADGFHELETIMYPVPIYDVLEFLPSERFTLAVYGEEIPGKKEDNLLYKTWKLLYDRHQIPFVSVRLLKSIPIGSGLGGGSSDAMFFLKGLNEYAGLSLDEETILNYASRLGSDCPFFVKNTAVQVQGRGEKLKAIELSLKGKFFVLVAPGIHIDTAEAYKIITPKISGTFPGEAVKLPPAQWRHKLYNDFESPLFARHPVMQQIKDTLYSEGAIYASLTGSGSAIYGIFAHPINIKHQFPEFFIRTEILK